ncbi:MAG: ROK family protein [Verrucomicrobiaceae bacterium]|nr:ROK family protein [Verrucomicrobiaceae bacterium]
MNDTSNLRAIGIDFGATSVKIGALPDILKDGGEEPVVLETLSYSSVNDLIDAIAESVAGIGKRHGNMIAVGCGVPGLVDFDRGFVHTLTNVPGWQDIALRDILERETGLPVFIDNDANCMAYAEWRFGAALGLSNVVALTLGTGIGGGMIIDGKLYRGSSFAAGEIGQMSIDHKGGPGPYGLPGILEGHIGNRQISELAATRLHDQPMPAGGWTPRSVAEMAVAGNPQACQIWLDVAECLGSLLASIAWLINPDAFVIGGGVANAADLLFDPLEKKIRASVSSVISDDLRILPAKFGNEAGIVGSAAQALDAVLERR